MLQIRASTLLTFQMAGVAFALWCLIWTSTTTVFAQPDWIEFGGLDWDILLPQISHIARKITVIWTERCS